MTEQTYSNGASPSSVKISSWIITSLNKVSPDLVPIYRDFCQDYVAGGYAQLSADIEKFKKEVDENQMRIVAMQIFDRYWSPVTQYDVVIKDKARQQLQEDIDNWKIALDIFDPVLRKIEEDCYKKFTMCEKYASFMADRGTYVRTASPRRRLSVTDLFVKKGAQGRRSSLGVSAWSPKNSAEIMDLDDGIVEEDRLGAVLEEQEAY